MGSTSTDTFKFNVGDLVWAKMKGFSPWPGKIVDGNAPNIPKQPASSRSKQQTFCVYFFGSDNFAWIVKDSIKPYQELKEKNSNSSKSHAFKEAIEKIEAYIKDGGKGEIPPSDSKLSEKAEVKKPASSKSKPADEKKEKEKEKEKDKDKEKETSATATATKSSTSTTVNSNSSSKDEKVASTNVASPSAPAQKDYSRQPFGKSKPKKTASNASSPPQSDSTSNEDLGAPPAKRNKSSHEEPVAVTSPTKAVPKGARNFIDRPSKHLTDNNSLSATNQEISSAPAKSKTIKASKLKFGFIGIGFMGSRLLNNLITSGHSVTIWNRTPTKCKDFIKAGATKVTTPSDVIAASDITFSCLSDPHSVKEIVFGNCGVLGEINSGKSYVEMTTIDPETSTDISEAIMARGGRYLEAPVISGGKAQTEEGNLIVIAAGDKMLFDECNSCFQAISKHSFYLGATVGDASKMSLVISMLMGNMLCSLAESLALADKSGLSQKDLLEILTYSPVNNQTLIRKGQIMIEGAFPAEMSLSHLQKDLRLAVNLSESYELPLPITAMSNEVFKHAKHSGYSDHDATAVYVRARY